MDNHEQESSLQEILISISQEHSANKFDKNEFFEEAKKQLWLAAPLLSVNVLLFCIQVISLMFVGHTSELSLSGASMAASFTSVTGFSLLIGSSSALETFCGQSYGAKQYHELGIHLQRAIFVLLLISIPLACIWAYTGHILSLLGQDPHISAEAGLFARFSIPTIFPYAILQCQVRFLQSQNNVVPMMICTGITALLHVPLCWILVFKSGFGAKGAALANGLTYFLIDLFLAQYIRFSSSCKNTWTGFSMEALYDILDFLRLAVPSATMTCLEIWSFETMVLLGGLLPNPTLETSVLSISLNTSTVFYMIPLGIGSVISIRVSNELGAGRPKAARLAVRVAMFIVTIESLLIATTMILGRKVWGYSYSRKERVVKYVAEMMFLIAATHVCDGVQCVVNGSYNLVALHMLAGVARGSGWQKIGAFINLGAYYLIGIPVGILLAFVYHIGGKGLWTGIIAAVFVQSLILFIITVRADWEQEAKKASGRLHVSMIKEEAVT